jgi:hypothetical protein
MLGELRGFGPGQESESALDNIDSTVGLCGRDLAYRFVPLDELDHGRAQAVAGSPQRHPQGGRRLAFAIARKQKHARLFTLTHDRPPANQTLAMP